MGRPREDITGKTFNRLTAIEIDKDKSNNSKRITYWKCKCICGSENYISVSITDLKRGHTKSCGCLLKENCSNIGKQGLINNMIGKQFGRLTVIKQDPNINCNWICVCDCGSNIEMSFKGTELRAGRFKSCGCIKRDAAHDYHFIDLIGMKFGRLTVVKEHEGSNLKRKTGVLWDCICDCGGNKIVSSSNLRQGKVLSCGCLISKNEDNIKNILTNNNINYDTQVYFDNLRSPITNKILRFDFGVYKGQELSFLIEYDGEQHEYGTRYSSNPKVNKEKFERQKLYDELKNYYCINNNIDLLRISWREQDNLEKILINKLKEKEII